MSSTRILTDLFSHSGTWFLRDYMQCREAYLSQLQSLPSFNGVESRSWCLSKEDALYCDTTWLGQKDARSVVIIISGTHGVEGYCGSAVQRFLLGRYQAGDLILPNNVAMLIVHSLNPWGMKYGRRCDQEGIDLNRNVIDFNQLPAVLPEYSLCLEKLTQTDDKGRETLMQKYAQQYGQSGFDRIFSGGQYHCSWGPFYGGTKPSWSSQLIDSIVVDYQLAARKLVVIDVHSGLGPWGFGELISDHPAGSAGEHFACSLFGPAVASVEEGNSFSVSKFGLQDYRWHKLMEQDGCFLTLEFGTYGTDELFNVLLNDHLLWRNKDTSDPMFSDQQALQNSQQGAMLEHFCPDQLLWQQSVLFKSWQVISQTLKGLSDA